MSTAKQEGDLMTRAEYEALYDEYWNTDSLKRREEIEDKIWQAARALFSRVRDIFDKYNARNQLITDGHDEDYREDSGSLGLAREDFGAPMMWKEHLLLRYSDRWAFGECSFTICLYTKWFDPDERKKLATELKEMEIARLEKAIESAKEEIARQQHCLQEHEAAVAMLKGGDEADANDEE